MSAALRPRTALAICTGWLLLFGTLSWTAVRHESVTYDETVHSLACFATLRLHDYRINVEHPVLWKYWAALPELFTNAFHINTQAEDWKLAPTSRYRQARLVQDNLFHTPDNGTAQLFTRERLMMLLIGLALGAMIGWWAYRLAGTLAATISVFFYALDPNFLGHAPLITNDVAMSLAFCALMYTTWRVGQAASWPRAIRLALMCGVALTVKYSALVCGPIVVTLLLIRVLLRRPWTIFGREVTKPGARFGRVVIVSLLCMAVAYGCVWASYGFRYGVSSDPNLHMDLHHEVILEAKFHLIGEHPGVRPTDAQAEAYPVGLFMRTMLVLAKHRVLPEPFIDGLMYVHANATIRRTYLLGRVTILGSALYFPVAMLVKTPVGTMIAILASLAFIGIAGPWRRRDSPRIWDAVCLTLPPIVYFSFALQAHLNLGLRHVYPTYPFLFIAIGVAGATAIQRYARPAMWLIGVLASALLIESVAAYPDYIPFFNAPSGGARGGLALLGDSNLDWGQGLKRLHEWQVQHPGQRMGLAYFGSADPKFYGVVAETLAKQGPDGFQFRIAPDTDVTAISASMLQAILLDPHSQKLMRFVRETQRPFAIVDESIYLYRTADIFRAFEQAVSAKG